MPCTGAASESLDLNIPPLRRPVTAAVMSLGESNIGERSIHDFFIAGCNRDRGSTYSCKPCRDGPRDFHFRVSSHRRLCSGCALRISIADVHCQSTHTILLFPGNVSVALVCLWPRVFGMGTQ